jgi:hypothetical protein
MHQFGVPAFRQLLFPDHGSRAVGLYRTATKHSRVGGRFKNSVVIFLAIIHDE